MCKNIQNNHVYPGETVFGSVYLVIEDCVIPLGPSRFQIKPWMSLGSIYMVMIDHVIPLVSLGVSRFKIDMVMKGHGND